LPGQALPCDPRMRGGDGLEKAIALDRRATGSDRALFLHRLFRETGAEWWQVDEPDGRAGFAVLRPGDLATHIGPCVATEPGLGRRLLREILMGRAGEPVVVDVPLSQEDILKTVRELNLTERRRFMRMTRGPRLAEQVDMICASSGPELG